MTWQFGITQMINDEDGNSISGEEAPAPDLRDVLRAKLVHMRTELVEMLARKDVDGGMLALLGSVDAAIEAIDRMPGAGAVPATRAVVADDHQTIMLTLFDDTGRVAAVDLAPVGAVALAGRLLAAASARLSR